MWAPLTNFNKLRPGEFVAGLPCLQTGENLRNPGNMLGEAIGCGIQALDIILPLERSFVAPAISQSTGILDRTHLCCVHFSWGKWHKWHKVSSFKCLVGC